ncbi:MAG: hypothetical protein ABI606_10695 [Rhodoferax sp.]
MATTNIDLCFACMTQSFASSWSQFLAGPLAEECGSEESDALVFRNPIKSTDFLPLLALSYQTTDSQQREVLMELPLVISAMTNPLQVPSIFKGQAVREVSVSLLLPTILKGAVDRSNPVEDMA